MCTGGISEGMPPVQFGLLWRSRHSRNCYYNPIDLKVALPMTPSAVRPLSL